MASTDHDNYEIDITAAPDRDDGKIVTGPPHQLEYPDIPVAMEPLQEESPAEQRRSTRRITLILIALFLSLFVAALDGTIVSTAVPIMTHDLDSATGYTWIGGAYLLANCVAGPIWAKLSDIWGRRLILASSIAVFTAGSVICAVAKTMTVLIAGRAVQGAAAGCMVMLVHICISDIFSVRRRSLIMGLTEGVWACAGGIGPVLGGVFASLLSWRWCFWINLPLCSIAFVLTLLFLDVKHESTSFIAGIRAVDWFGITAFLGFTLMLLLGLDFGGSIYPWSSAKVIALLVVGAIFIFVFIYGETRVARYPLMPLDLFKQTSNVASLAVTFFHGLVFMNSEYYLPLFFQSVLGVTPLVSGLLLLSFILCSGICGVISGIVIHRTGRFVELMWVGSLLLFLGNGLYLTWNVNVSITKIVGILVIAGCGTGILFEPPLIAIQTRVSQQDVATATSTFSFVRSMAVSVCVVIGGAVFQNSMDRQSTFLSNAGLSESVVEKLSGKNAAANVMIAETLSDPAQASVVKEAFAWSIRNMFILYAVLAFCGFVSSWFVKKSHLAHEHVETVTGIRSQDTDKSLTS